MTLELTSFICLKSLLNIPNIQKLQTFLISVCIDDISSTYTDSMSIHNYYIRPFYRIQAVTTDKPSVPSYIILNFNINSLQHIKMTITIDVLRRMYKSCFIY